MDTYTLHHTWSLKVHACVFVEVSSQSVFSSNQTNECHKASQSHRGLHSEDPLRKNCPPLGKDQPTSHVQHITFQQLNID